MKRTQYLVQHHLRHRAIRNLSQSSASLKKQPGKLDTTGRTPGFARRSASNQRSQPPSRESPSEAAQTTPPDKVANALQAASSENTNQLLAPVHIPEDRHGILRPDHPATSILANSSIVVQRQLEMMNVLMGFEQANKYVLMDSTGNHIGFLAEQDHGIGKAVARQMFSTHRSFTTHVFDKNEREILRVCTRIQKSSTCLAHKTTVPPTILLDLLQYQSLRRRAPRTQLPHIFKCPPRDQRSLQIQPDIRRNLLPTTLLNARNRRSTTAMGASAPQIQPIPASPTLREHIHIRRTTAHIRLPTTLHLQSSADHITRRRDTRLRAIRQRRRALLILGFLAHVRREETDRLRKQELRGLRTRDLHGYGCLCLADGFCGSGCGAWTFDLEDWGPG